MEGRSYSIPYQGQTSIRHFKKKLVRHGFGLSASVFPGKIDLEESW